MERKILTLFVQNEKMKFSDIEKALSTRSNKLTYHLKNLMKKGILEKEDIYYKISKEYEHLIPYISDKHSPLPVVLIHIGDKNYCFLIKRDKRPFQNKLALPGGRILVGESINQAVKRIMKEKFGIDSKLSSIKSLSIEHVKGKDKRLHSFLLIFVSAKTQKSVMLTNIEENKFKIISSDYQLLKNIPSSEMKVKTLYSKD
jgi:ADP-ribose pyrophosphatase YjhB (NUDIX family)